MLKDERLTPGPTDTEQATGHDHAALLAVAARELRVIVTTADARAVPAEFAAMATARLLEEISRAARGGHELPQHVLNAALEIARHTMSHFRDSGPTIGGRHSRPALTAGGRVPIHMIAAEDVGNAAAAPLLNPDDIPSGVSRSPVAS